MAIVYARKFKSGYRVYIKLRDGRGKWRYIKTPFKFDKMTSRNGKTIWPKQVLDLKQKIEAAQALKQFGFEATKSKRSLSLTQLFELFVKESGIKREPSTIKEYRGAVNKFISIHGDKDADSITFEDMYVFRDEMLRAVSKITVKKYLTHLNGLFNWAADPESDLISKNPISRNIKFTVKTPERPGFTDEELRQVFEESIKKGDSDLKLQLEFLYLTGFRSNESCKYRLDQFDFENKVLKHYNQKRDDYYTYPMDTKLEEFLKQLPTKYAPYAFKYRSIHTLSRYLKRIVRKLGLNDRLSVHSLKVSYVNRLKRAGLNAASIHMLSHHRSFQTTMTYIRWDTEHLRKELEKSR
jgi:integrase/recombinase XerD